MGRKKGIQEQPTDLGITDDGLKLYSTKEVSEILRVTYVTVMRMIKDGRLQASKVGNSWRISAAQLKDYLASMETKKKR